MTLFICIKCGYEEENTPGPLDGICRRCKRKARGMRALLKYEGK